MRQYKTIPCKGCGEPVRTSLKKPYCSHECRIANKPLKFVWKVCECITCGRPVERKEYAGRPIVNAACSAKCQYKFAAKCGHVSMGHDLDRTKKSREAKMRYYRKRSDDRRRTSGFSLWMSTVSRNTTYVDGGAEWIRKCASVASCFSKREVNAHKQTANKQDSWSSVVDAGKIVLRGDLREVWKEKTKTCSSSLGRRLRLGKKNTYLHT